MEMGPPGQSACGSSIQELSSATSVEMSRAFITKINAFTPLAVPGCQLWMDAADSTTITRSGANVTQWNDKANNYSGSATNNPQYNSSPINGLPTIHFDGASNRYVLISANNYNYSFMTYFIVIRWVSGTTGGFMGTDTPGNYGRALAVSSSNVQLLLYSQFYTTTVALTANQPCILSAYFNGTTNFTVILNGTPTVFAVGQGAGNTNTNGFNIGVFNPGNSGNHSFDMGEGIVYNSILSDAQRQQVEGYLAQKWGLTASLPPGHPGLTQTFYTKNPGIAAVPSFTMTKVPYTNYFPLSMPACGLWLDAADASTITYSSGSNLSQWRDKSGNGYIMSNNAGTTTVAANSLNSLNTVYIPSGTNTKITNFRGRTKMTFFIVGKCAAGQYLIALNGGFFYVGNDSLLYMYPPSGNYLDIVDSIGIATPVVSNNTWFIICIGYDNLTNSTANPYTINGSPFNGTNRATAARGSSGILTDQFITNTLYINTVNGTNSYDSDFTAELIYYNDTLSVGQRQAVEGYLAWKWGLQSTNLPVGHPYYSTPPIEFGRPAQVAGIPLQVNMFATPNLTLPSNTITNGLIAYFLFNGTLLDSRNTITLSQTGSVSYVAGLRDKAIYLANETQSSNGTTAVNYLTSSYNVTVPFSVAVWFNPTNVTRGSLLSTYNSTAITNYSVNLYIQGAGGGISAAYNGVQNVGAYSSISVGTWYSAVITVNASNGLSLFVNGTQVGSTITQTPSINGLMIGNIQDGGGSYAYSGYMDDYRIYNRVLSGSEITSIYNGTG